VKIRLKNSHPREPTAPNNCRMTFISYLHALRWKRTANESDHPRLCAYCTSRKEFYGEIYRQPIELSPNIGHKLIKDSIQRSYLGKVSLRSLRLAQSPIYFPAEYTRTTCKRKENSKIDFEKGTISREITRTCMQTWRDNAGRSRETRMSWKVRTNGGIRIAIP